MGDQETGTVVSSSDLGTTASHPLRVVHSLYVAPSTAGEVNSFALDILPVACMALADILFEFDSSFVTPHIANVIKDLPGLREKHRGKSGKLPTLTIFGHADPTGEDEYNKKLSGRRALAVYGLLTQDVSVWENLYNDPRGGDDWKSKNVVSSMKKALGDGAPGAREDLFRAYMEKLCPFKLEKKDFLGGGADSSGKADYLGCGEFNPLRLLSQKENQKLSKPQRNKENQPNRRVVIYVFRPGDRVNAKTWPCPAATDPGSACKDRFFVTPVKGDDRRKPGAARREHDKLKDTQDDTFACRFYDRIAHVSPCEGAKPGPGLLEVKWDGDAAEIHPVYYPVNDKQKVRLVVKTAAVPDSPDGSAFEIKVLGYYEKLPDSGEDKRTAVEMPASLLGITAPADIKVESNELKNARAGDRPAMELRIPWETVAAADGKNVYPAEMHGFRALVKFAGTPDEMGTLTAEVKRTIPVVVFANPDAVEAQERFWKSGEKIRDDAKNAGRLALLEAGRTPGKASVFVDGASRGKIPVATPLKHMRGSSHTFYRGHGYLYTADKKDPCSCCIYRARWDSLDQDDRIQYISNTLKPFKYNGTTKKWDAVTWTRLRKHVKDKDAIFIRFDIDESAGDPDFTPRTTEENASWTTRIGNMIKGLFKWDLDQIREGLQFCMRDPDIAWIRAAAALKLNGYQIPANTTGATGPAFYGNSDADATFKRESPDVVGTPAGTAVPAGTPIYLMTVAAKCEQGEDTANQRAGFIFWQMSDGTTFANAGGRSVMCFDPGDLGEEEVDGLDGRQPTPTELMYASGCLTAATPELAEKFLEKGTRVYVGNRIVAWGNWNRQMADSFSGKVFGEGKKPEDAFNELKGEYVGKLRCAIWVKKADGDSDYVDH